MLPISSYSLISQRRSEVAVIELEIYVYFVQTFMTFRTSWGRRFRKVPAVGEFLSSVLPRMAVRIFELFHPPLADDAVLIANFPTLVKFPFRKPIPKWIPASFS